MSEPPQRVLELEGSGLPMGERLVRAAGRLLEPSSAPAGCRLRHEQVRVFDDFAT